MNNNRLRITEIFYSLQGEAKTVGLPTVFVRLTGCPLRCQYCDTAYAFHGGEYYQIEEVLDKVAQHKTPYVTVTGGEPLAQPGCIELLRQLCDRQYQVSLETSGALDVSDVDPRVSKVIDVKTPGSGEHLKNRFENFEYLSNDDQVKFVICHEDDYLWSKEIVEKHLATKQCEILFSPSYEQMDKTKLAELILADKLNVRFQLQMHKILWGDLPGK